MIGAQILIAGAAGRAFAATDPGIHRDTVADRCIGPFAGGFDHAGDFVAKRERQRAVLGDVELLAAAEIKIAVLNMQVGMADAAAFDADQHFAVARLGQIGNGLA